MKKKKKRTFQAGSITSKGTEVRKSRVRQQNLALLGCHSVRNRLRRWAKSSSRRTLRAVLGDRT